VTPHPNFRYPDQDWLAISALLPSADTAQHGQDRRALEAIVQNFFLWLAVRTDPRTSQVVAAKARWTKLAGQLKAVEATLTELEAMQTRPTESLWLTVADILVDSDVTVTAASLRAGYVAWKTKNAAVARFAARAARGHPKSLVVLAKDAKGRPIKVKPGPNRARGDLVDELFAALLRFWVARGGRIGKGAESPSTKFVEAAAGRILSETIQNSTALIVTASRNTAAMAIEVTVTDVTVW
jgi:hypothetical protein